MTCPNCDAAMSYTHTDTYRWCSRCGTATEMTPSGRVRRIHIPILTQQSTPAERNGQRQAIGSNGL